MARSVRPGALAAALLFAAVAAASRTPDDESRLGRFRPHEEGAAKRASRTAWALARASAGRKPQALPPSAEGSTRGYDVLSYDLTFRLDPAVRELSGRAEIRVAGVARETDAITLDLDASYDVPEVLRDGHAVADVVFDEDRLRIPLVPPLTGEERTTLTVSWEGTPPAYGALQFFPHDTGDAAATVAEPFGARTFWPCVDDPLDRAVVTVRADVPAGYVVTSAGPLVESGETAGGRTVWTWRFDRPISSYLVSLNVANYSRIDASYTRPDGSAMPVVGYVFPEDVVLNRSRIAAIPGYITTLASLYGEYPFVDAKYGVVASWFGGGMEHPTMTSIGATILGNPAANTTLLFVHELAHQWWGDEVTMRTWDDIWLNEGFATYSEVLYREKASGSIPGQVLSSVYDDRIYAGALAGTVVAPADDPFADTDAVYAKGAWFLHMLRRRVGDDAFFAGLATYRARHAYATASRGDLRHDFEETTGRDLKGFFDQWLETPFRPILRVAWSGAPDAASVDVTVRQTQSHDVVHPVVADGDVAWYRFPLTVHLVFTDGRSRDVVLEVDARESTIRVPTPERTPLGSIAVDPAGDLLKIVESVGPL